MNVKVDQQVVELQSASKEIGDEGERDEYNCGQFWEKNVRMADDELFKDYFRMDRKCFYTLADKIPKLSKRKINNRKSIPLEKRIGIALFVLGSSLECRKVSRLFGVPEATVRFILKEFCKEVWRILSPEYLPAQFLTEEKVADCVKGFEELGFPQCFGAIDGCHIEIQTPRVDAADYCNSKGWFSTILMAVVDYRYRFSYISVGCPGRCTESQLFESSDLKRQLVATNILKQNSKNISGEMVPVVILADSAFRFSEYLIKPFTCSAMTTDEQKIFNYHHSKSCRVVENAFWHLKARFRRIGKVLENSPSTAKDIIKGCCVLHNFLNSQNSTINDSWLDEANKTLTREQPTLECAARDTDLEADKIRKAISVHLARRSVEQHSGVEESQQELRSLNKS